MRGSDQPQTSMFSYLSVEDQIPATHRLRTIQALVNPVLANMSRGERKAFSIRIRTHSFAITWTSFVASNVGTSQ